MKIALSSYSGYGAWFALRLLAEGHDVDYFLSKPEYAEVLQGLIKPKLISLDHRMKHESIGFPDYSRYDVSVFDLTGRKRQADYSYSCCPTIGDGSFHCILEDYRLKGIELMEEAGITVPPYESFQNINEARAYVKKTGKRYVFKPNGGQDQDAASTYVSKDAEDLLEYFDKLSSISKGVSFILQEFIPGTECSVEGWFNGSSFYLLNATIEDKKFMNDNIGPNTGCSGNLVFNLRSDARIFKEGLDKTKDILSNVGFRGMIDLNTIITDTNIYGLEWTPRFGYDASATLACMYGGNFGDLLYKTASGSIPDESWNSSFGSAIRVSIPPYPTEMKMAKSKDIPIKGVDPADEKQMMKTYLYDARCENSHLVTNGINGLVAVLIETGSSPDEAFDKVYDRVKHIQIPDMQYRTDLKKSLMKRYNEVEKMGWFGAA